MKWLYFIRQTFSRSSTFHTFGFSYIIHSFIHTLASFFKITYFLCRQHLHLTVVLSMANLKSQKSVGVWNICYILHEYVSFKIPSAWIKNYFTDSQCVNHKLFVCFFLQIPSAWIIVFIQDSKCLNQKFILQIPSAWIIFSVN